MFILRTQQNETPFPDGTEAESTYFSNSFYIYTNEWMLYPDTFEIVYHTDFPDHNVTKVTTELIGCYTAGRQTIDVKKGMWKQKIYYKRYNEIYERKDGTTRSFKDQKPFGY